MSGKGIWTIIGFIVAPLISSVLYALLTHSGGNLFFTFTATLIIAYAITVFVMMPSFLILKRKSAFSLSKVALFSFGAVFILFVSYLLYTNSMATQIISGTKTLVDAGSITMDGYIHYLTGAVKIASFSLLGGLIFYFFERKTG